MCDLGVSSDWCNLQVAELGTIKEPLAPRSHSPKRKKLVREPRASISTSVGCQGGVRSNPLLVLQVYSLIAHRSVQGVGFLSSQLLSQSTTVTDLATRLELARRLDHGGPYQGLGLAPLHQWVPQCWRVSDVV